MINESKYKAWLCLKTAPEVGFKTAQKLIEIYGDPLSFVGNPGHEIYRAKELSDKAKNYLVNGCIPDSYNQIVKLIDHYDIHYLVITDDDYPDSLREIYSPPLIIYYRGDFLDCLESVRLGVVGTRKPSAYGREMTRKLLQPISDKSVCIISGLAMGIDTISHQTALAGRSKTIAVLASGVESIYPPINRDLALKIIENGALISEYEPGSKMEKWNFPARNRIISALSQAVMIVEGSITSGALLTAKFALEQNRDILALPGNINITNAQGPNHLIKNGAAIITCTEDIMRILGIDEQKDEQIDLFPILSETEQQIYQLIKKEQRLVSFDELVLITGCSFGKLSIALLNLELKGMIAKSSGNSYIIL